MAQTPTPGRLPGLIAAGAAVLLIAGITGALFARVALTQSSVTTPPLPVSNITFQVQDTYTRRASALGLVVAGNRSQLGFELAGRIARLNVHEGSRVSTGTLLATLDDASLQAQREALEADIAAARAELELAQLNARRQADLVNTGAVSREASDETRLRAAALAARLSAAVARLANIDISLEKSQLIAPYEGVVADRYVQAGAVVAAGTPVLRLIQTGVLEAHVGVPARFLRELSAGNTYTLRLHDTDVPATLLNLRSDVDPMTRTAKAVFSLPPDAPAIDGETITLIIDETVPAHGGWLPLTALIEGQRGLWTVMKLVASPEGGYITQREAVEVVEVRGQRAFVRGTLLDGDTVIASGPHRVTPGTRVALMEG